MSRTSDESSSLEAFSRVRRHLNLIATHKLKPLGIGPKQALFLRYLGSIESTSLADLSRATVTDPAATSRTIDTLITKGWVNQKEHPEDRRRWQVSLSKKGTELTHEIDSIFQQIAYLFCEPLAGKEKSTFLLLLLKVQNHLAHKVTKDAES